MTRRHLWRGVLGGFAVIVRAARFILREDGGYVLREDGSRFLREDA